MPVKKTKTFYLAWERSNDDPKHPDRPRTDDAGEPLVNNKRYPKISIYKNSETGETKCMRDKGQRIGTSNKVRNMDYLSQNPELGHITTFGGHPVSCAAALATFNELKTSTIIESILNKRNLFEKHLKHPKIKNIHGVGLMIAIEFENEKYCLDIVKKLLENGVITFYFLFNRNNIRISPPLRIKKMVPI